MEHIKNLLAEIEAAQAIGEHEKAYELSNTLELATTQFRRELFTSMRSAEAAARKAENLSVKRAAVDFDGVVKFEFTSPNDDIQWTYIVQAENGDEKRGYGWSNITEARRAMKSQLRAYDRKSLGASGSLLRVEVAA
jgi:hypothetical protein